MTHRCPICRAPIPQTPGQKRAAFCSPRCQQVDLGRWLKGDYAIPAEPMPDAEDEDR
jgi:hypothetical protein